MHNRRAETRMLCADLVDVQWKDKNGRTRRAIANLEDISLSGACIQVEAPIPIETHAADQLPERRTAGSGLLLRVSGNRLLPGHRVRARISVVAAAVRPQHLLDPRRLMLSYEQYIVP